MTGSRTALVFVGLVQVSLAFGACYFLGRTFMRFSEAHGFLQAFACEAALTLVSVTRLFLAIPFRGMRKALIVQGIVGVAVGGLIYVVAWAVERVSMTH